MKQCGSKCTSSISSAQAVPHSSKCTSIKSSAQAVPPLCMLCPGGVCHLCHLCCCLHGLYRVLGFICRVDCAFQLAGIKAKFATCWCTIRCKLTILRSIWLHNWAMHDATSPAFCLQVDQLLQPHFAEDMARLTVHCGKRAPRGRQTVMVSATLTAQVIEAAQAGPTPCRCSCQPASQWDTACCRGFAMPSWTPPVPSQLRSCWPCLQCTLLVADAARDTALVPQPRAHLCQERW